jgi:hypothetical protein
MRNPMMNGGDGDDCDDDGGDADIGMRRWVATENLKMTMAMLGWVFAIGGD